MLLSQDRQQMRCFIVEAWRKRQTDAVLDPLEKIVVSVVERHPEYHSQLEDASVLDRDYRPERGETNPFLHIAMHIAIQEQLAANRPPGVLDIFRTLLSSHGGAHALEHAMMECLGACLSEAQQRDEAPSEDDYLDCVKRLARSTRSH